MHLICPAKFCITFVFYFYWVLQHVPREIDNNAYAKFSGAKKVHYGRCESGVYGLPTTDYQLLIPAKFRLLTLN